MLFMCGYCDRIPTMASELPCVLHTHMPQIHNVLGKNKKKCLFKWIVNQ